MTPGGRFGLLAALIANPGACSEEFFSINQSFAYVPQYRCCDELILIRILTIFSEAIARHALLSGNCPAQSFGKILKKHFSKRVS
jgi:hypothetical protein